MFGQNLLFWQNIERHTRTVKPHQTGCLWLVLFTNNRVGICRAHRVWFTDILLYCIFNFAILQPVINIYYIFLMELCAITGTHTHACVPACVRPYSQIFYHTSLCLRYVFFVSLLYSFHFNSFRFILLGNLFTHWKYQWRNICR